MISFKFELIVFKYIAMLITMKWNGQYWKFYIIVLFRSYLYKKFTPFTNFIKWIFVNVNYIFPFFLQWCATRRSLNAAIC